MSESDSPRLYRVEVTKELWVLAFTTEEAEEVAVEKLHDEDAQADCNAVRVDALKDVPETIRRSLPWLVDDLNEELHDMSIEECFQDDLIDTEDD